uniref:CHK domain-containing protein n=1 Tax=Glossina brevipalpis TaxID=37001 RepID=A0A1A9WJG9_9MUSC
MFFTRDVHWQINLQKVQHSDQNLLSICKVLQSEVTISGLEHQLQVDNKKQSELIKDGALTQDLSWLNQQYMEQCLRSYYEDNKLKILKFQTMPCLGKGENYLGVLTRVKVEFSLSSKNGIKKRSYVVESMLQDNIFQEVYGSDIFLCEMNVYEQVIAKLKALLSGINEKEEIFVKTIAMDRQRSWLIFDDLNARNYVMVDRLKGLNREIAELILKKLAKMHAASVAQWPEFEDISHKLEKLKKNYLELWLRVFDPIANHLNVLNHGDLWSPDIMVKCDPVSRKPLNVIIIDFQFAVWGSPAIDLWYNFNTSLEKDLHLNKQDELIQSYYYTLSDTLKKLSFQGFHCTCFIQPAQRCINTDNADFSTLIQNNERGMRFKESCYTDNLLSTCN